MASSKSHGIQWVSKDGNWYWDGEQWQPVSPAMKTKRGSQGRRNAATVLAVLGLLAAGAVAFSVALGVMLGGTTSSDYAIGGWITVCCILSGVAAVIGIATSDSRPARASLSYVIASFFGLLTIGVAPVLVPIFGVAAVLMQRSIPKADRAGDLTSLPKQTPND